MSPVISMCAKLRFALDFFFPSPQDKLFTFLDVADICLADLKQQKSNKSEFFPYWQ